MEKGALAGDAMDVVAGQELFSGLVRNLVYYDALPVHPSPKRLESLTGYLTRLCEANGITSVDALVHLCFSSQSRRVAREQTDFPPLALASLASATACPESTLLLTTFQPIGQNKVDPMSSTTFAPVFRDGAGGHRPRVTDRPTGVKGPLRRLRPLTPDRRSAREPLSPLPQPTNAGAGAAG
jgi:TniQ